MASFFSDFEQNGTAINRHLLAKLKFAVSRASEWPFIYEAFPRDYG